MAVSLVGCEVDLSVDGIAGREGGHVEVHAVTDLVKCEGHGGEVGMCYCCVCCSRPHGSRCCDCMCMQNPF